MHPGLAQEPLLAFAVRPLVVDQRPQSAGQPPDGGPGIRVRPRTDTVEIGRRRVKRPAERLRLRLFVELFRHEHKLWVCLDPQLPGVLAQPLHCRRHP